LRAGLFGQLRVAHLAATYTTQLHNHEAKLLHGQHQSNRRHCLHTAQRNIQFNKSEPAEVARWALLDDTRLVINATEELQGLPELSHFCRPQVSTGGAWRHLARGHASGPSGA